MEANLHKKSVKNRIPGDEFYPVPINIRNLELFNFQFFDTIEVILFCYFVIKYRSFKTGFYYQQHRIENETGIKRAQFETRVKRFVQMGIVSREKKDFPAKWHFNINLDSVYVHLKDIYKTDHPNYPDIQQWFLAEFADIYKLNVETNKPSDDTNNKSAEISSVKEPYKDLNEKNSKEEGTGTGMNAEALDFLNYLNGKILYQLDEFDPRGKFDIATDFIPWYTKYGEALRIYVDYYFDSYIEKNHKNTVCGYMQTTDKEILGLIQKLQKKFISNRKRYNKDLRESDEEEKFIKAEDITLVVNNKTYKALLKLLCDAEEEDILNAWNAYCDEINEGTITVTKNIINYFASDPQDNRSYPVYEQCSTRYLNYGHYE